MRGRKAESIVNQNFDINLMLEESLPRNCFNVSSASLKLTAHVTKR